MNTAEIKIELFKKLDNLKGKKLREAYGILVNFINGNRDINEWDNLTPEQKEAIQLGVDQLNTGKGRPHNEVISDLRKRFING